jgi:protein-tyrosine-phosphatase
MKEPTVFRVLFLDERNDLVSQLAQAIAAKAFPAVGVYSSAGWAPAEELHPALEQAADRYGFDASRLRPKQVGEIDGFPAPYHVVVAIDAEDESALPNIPYHTILRKWRIDTDYEDVDELMHELSNRIDTMVERLRGKNGA